MQTILRKRNSLIIKKTLIDNNENNDIKNKK